MNMNEFRVIVVGLLAFLGGAEIQSEWSSTQRLRGIGTSLHSTRVLTASVLYDGQYRLDARALAMEVSTTGSVGYSRSYKPVNLGATKLSDGKVAIVWESFGEDRSMLAVMGTEFDPLGEGTGITTLINQYTEGDQSLPSIVSLAGGGRAIVWQSFEQDGSSWGVYERVFNADGSATDENVVATTSVDSQQFGVLSALPAELPGEELPGGGAVVAWRAFVLGADNAAHIFLRFISADGTVQGDEIQVDGTNGVARARPSALALKDGSGVFVSWVDVSGYIYGRFLAINDDGTTTWNADPFQISQLGNSSIDPALAQFTLHNHYSPVTVDSAELDDGTIVVTWLGFLGEPYNGIVYGILVNPRIGAIGEEFALSSVNAFYSPSVAAISTDTTELADNIFVVGWASETSSYFQVGMVTVTEQQQGSPSYSILLGKIVQANDEGSQAGSPPAVLGLDELRFVLAYPVFEGDGTASIVSQVYEVDPSELVLEVTPPPDPPSTPPPDPPISDNDGNITGGGESSSGGSDDSTLYVALGVSLGAVALIALGGGGYIYYKHRHKVPTPST